MRNFQFRFVLSIVSLFSILIIAMPVAAAPVRLNQVIQVINAKPGKAAMGDFSQLRLANGYVLTDDDDDDDDKTTKPTTTAPPQDDRVITETKTEIVENEVCDCEEIPPAKGGFPYWVLGFGAIPLLFLIPHRDRTPTPTATLPPPITQTPTPPETPTTPTPTPTTPTPTPTTPTPTPTTPTPPMTPTPTPPEAIPEPMTLLLFGTGLASVGLAARKKFGKKEKTDTEN